MTNVITLWRCKCGRYKRFGLAEFIRDLITSEGKKEERRMFIQLINSGAYRIQSWTCPFCKLGITQERKE
jgi:hypothetical protein